MAQQKTSLKVRRNPFGTTAIMDLATNMFRQATRMIRGIRNQSSPAAPRECAPLYLRNHCCRQHSSGLGRTVTPRQYAPSEEWNDYCGCWLIRAGGGW